jgi:hypothetical protein
MRLNDLTREQRLDLIEETRLLHGQDYTKACIDTNTDIMLMVAWPRTRQGFEYWSWIYNGSK